jgi:hypothetical protein
MSIRSGQSIVVEFTTRAFATGVGVNADSLPTGTLIVNGVDNAAVVTVTNTATGRYKASVTLPTLAVGDIVELSIAATVGGIADSCIFWRDTKDILIDSSGFGTFNNTTVGVSGDFSVTMKTSLNASTPASVQNIFAQTGDSYARLGTPAGASIAADIAEVEAETDGIAAIPTNPYTGTPPTTAQIATAVWEDLTAGGDFGTAGSVGKLLVTTGPGWYTAPNNAGITSILADCGAIIITLGTPAGASIAADIAEVEADVDALPVPLNAAGTAAAVWNALSASYNTASTMGHLLNAAGADPLLNNPATYVPGEIGWDIAQTYASLSAVTVTYVSPVQPATGQILIYQGSAYTLTSGRPIILAIPPAVQNLSSGVDHLELRWPGVTIRDTTVSNPGASNQSVTFEANATLTAAWTLYDGPFYVWAVMTDATENQLDVTGRVTILGTV